MLQEEDKVLETCTKMKQGVFHHVLHVLHTCSKVKMYVYLLEAANTINFVSRMHNGGGTPLCPVEYDINEIVGWGD